MTSLIAILIGLGLQACAQGQSRQADSEDRMSALALRSSQKTGGASGDGGDPGLVVTQSASSRPAVQRPAATKATKATKAMKVTTATKATKAMKVTTATKAVTQGSPSPTSVSAAPWVPEPVPNLLVGRALLGGRR